jgi:Fe-S-cluster containining protein
MAEVFNLEKYLDQVQRTTMEHLSAATNKDALAEMMKMITEAAEGELAVHRDGGEHIACRAGCGTCCSLNVAVLFPEVIAIVEFVRTHWPPERQRMLEDRVAELFGHIRWLDEEERISLRQSCAFLDESSACTIYPVRPLICRAITSIDAHHCEEALEAATTGAERPIFMNMFQKSLMEGTFIAVAQGLTQLGFDDNSGELTVGVQAFLETPALAERFLERKNVWTDQVAGR